jgi:U3 small nucleolar RNA-associated protein 10
MQLQVDGLSHEDPVAVMPCLTALQNLQPVFFENLKNDTKVYVCPIILYAIVRLVKLQLFAHLS